MPANNFQISTDQNTNHVQQIAIKSDLSDTGTILNYMSSNCEGQLILPVRTLNTSDFSTLKIVTSMGEVSNGMVLTTAPARPTDNLAKEAMTKRKIRLMKNSEAARECRVKKKEYIKCLENRVAVLEGQNKTLVDELQRLKNLYSLNDLNDPNLM